MGVYVRAKWNSKQKLTLHAAVPLGLMILLHPSVPTILGTNTDDGGGRFLQNASKHQRYH
jgi:hypothetical protein